MEKNFSVRLLASISELESKELNPLSDSLFFSFEWFKAIEEAACLPAKPMHAAVFSGKTLAAFLPCYEMHGAEFIPFSKTLGTLSPFFRFLGFKDNSYLSVFSPYCLESRFLVNSAFSADREKLFSLALEAIKEKARKKNQFIAAPYVSGKGALLESLLSNNGFYSKGAFDCAEIDCSAASFDAFLSSLSKNRRQKVIKEMNANKASGTRFFSSISFEGSGLLSSLADNTFFKHNGCKSPFTESFFRSIQGNMGEKARFFLAEKNGSILCFSLYFAGNRELTFFSSGSGALPGGNFAFFETSYYAPLRFAFDNGFSKLNLLSSDIETKKLRGAKTTQRKTMLFSGSGLKDFFLRALLFSAELRSRIQFRL
ncbi:MAG: peptidogalycan biosysnthesis protein [Candidatus Diapherotrites archaeon]